MNEGEAISLLNAKAEKLLQGLNEQAEYEQKEFEKYLNP
jgi:hypothetical protein